MASWWNKPVGHGSFIVFTRLNRFYKTFLVLSGLVSALSAGVLQFAEFHPTQTPLQRLAEGFFVSSASTAVISAMLGTMLLFRFEGYTTASHKDLALAWSPLVILDWSILSFLAGLIVWYKDKNTGWRSSIIGATTGLCLLYTAWVSVDMWFAIKKPGGLGRDEIMGQDNDEQSNFTEKADGSAADGGLGTEDAPIFKRLTRSETLKSFR